MRARTRLPLALFALLAAVVLLAGNPPQRADAEDELPSWNEGPARQALVDFVARVTDPEHADFVPVPERIAVFDNDGTLWSEKPTYFQFHFVADRVRALMEEHPEWKTTQPYQAVIEGGWEAIWRCSREEITELLVVTHSGSTQAEFETVVGEWFRDARHPTSGRRYDEMVFLPMIELLGFLRANGFKTFIVSGGGLDFIRGFAEEAYGIPPEQVVGTSIELEYENTEEGPVLRRVPQRHFYNNHEGKPVGLQRHIGRRPVLAFGNSDGDFQMLEWSAAGEHPSLQLFLHHTDAEREWAYDRESKEGTLNQGLEEAPGRGWVVVDMARDWKRVFSFETP